jgi:hypothetical protein
LGLDLSVNNTVYLSVPIIEANKLCLDDTALVRLLQANPVLAPFWPILEAIIIVCTNTRSLTYTKQAEKVIPAHVFSVCAKVYDLHVSTKAATGCALLDANLMCLARGCVWKGETKFGCWDIPFPFGPEAALA